MSTSLWGIIVLKDLLNQKAVYFAYAGKNQKGAPSYADPVLINCRWSKTIVNMISPEGDEYTTTLQLLTDTAVTRDSAIVLADTIVGAVVDKNLIIRQVTSTETVSRDEILYSANL